MSNPRPVLIVGYSSMLVAEFDRFLPENGVVVLEEPDPVRKRGARAMTDGAAVCRELIETEFLLPGGADKFFLEHQDLDPVAVVPGHDYAVPAAARIAERYGVPGASLGAAEVLRDKHLLRTVAAAAGIGNPASRPVSSAEEVAAFQREVAGPIIIKPANRQASIGTLAVTDPATIPQAWEQCLDHEEESCLPDRTPELRMLVEQFVTGDEYSVEMLYSHGDRSFANVTAKVLHPGPRPVELGHLVPAPVSPELTALLVSETERLLAAIGFGTGLVHCEWIVQDGKPYLVECAGRQPGDFILELVQTAYRFDLFRAYADLMSGRRPECPQSAELGAATWHGTATPGEVISVDGVEDARALPGVQTCDVGVQVGKTVHPLRSSWDRTAVVTASGETALAAHATAKRAIELIRVETKQV
ncbi:ATP-grasp domain-containing protein [Lentzea sp. NPDC003310]|uniref:ATP-grasp domain-containing protein n=1 Tax=Lentzea sp. NPDC003310 TaxID=3154447 RepID=UPI0033B1AFA7